MRACRWRRSLRPRLTPDLYIENQFQNINGRYHLYAELIENANRQYEDYLDASGTAKKLDELLADIAADDAGGDADTV